MIRKSPYLVLLLTSYCWSPSTSVAALLFPQVTPRAAWSVCHARRRQQANDSESAQSVEDGQRRSVLSSAVLGAVSSSLTAMGQSPMAQAANVGRSDYLIPTPPNGKEFSWPLGKVAFSLLPLAGTSSRRATIQEEVVKDTIWTHDQIQGVVNVNVPVRQTVIRLGEASGGGLWVHNPVAPTPQLLSMMNQLVQRHGPVRHIVLGSVALEHKATFAAFSANFPNATVWLQPGQWSFPIDIPIEFYGLVQRGPRLREIPSSTGSSQYAYYAARDPIPEWTADIDYEILGPLRFNSVGAFSETAFYHRATHTLLVTDCVASVTRHPPAIVEEDARALLFHAREYATQDIEDTSETRQKGWRRMVQFGLVFFPSQVTVTPTLGQAFADARHVPLALKNLGQDAVPGDGTLYPWSWAPNDSDVVNFEAISMSGKLFCPPILTKLILDREPQATLDFCNRVCTRFRDMRRIIPCHLNNDVRVNGASDFYQAFDPLRSTPDRLVPQRALAEDLALLQRASDLLTRYGVVAPSQICDGEPARKKGRFAKQQIRNTREQ